MASFSVSHASLSCAHALTHRLPTKSCQSFPSLTNGSEARSELFLPTSIMLQYLDCNSEIEGTFDMIQMIPVCDFVTINFYAHLCLLIQSQYHSLSLFDRCLLHTSRETSCSDYDGSAIICKQTLFAVTRINFENHLCQKYYLTKI